MTLSEVLTMLATSMGKLQGALSNYLSDEDNAHINSTKQQMLAFESEIRAEIPTVLADYMDAHPPSVDLSAYALKTDIPAAPDLSGFALATDLAALKTKVDTLNTDLTGGLTNVSAAVDQVVGNFTVGNAATGTVTVGAATGNLTTGADGNVTTVPAEGNVTVNAGPTSPPTQTADGTSATPPAGSETVSAANTTAGDTGVAATPIASDGNVSPQDASGAPSSAPVASDTGNVTEPASAPAEAPTAAP